VVLFEFKSSTNLNEKKRRNYSCSQIDLSIDRSLCTLCVLVCTRVFVLMEISCFLYVGIIKAEEVDDYVFRMYEGLCNIFVSLFIVSSDIFQTKYMLEFFNRSRS